MIIGVIRKNLKHKKIRKGKRKGKENYSEKRKGEKQKKNHKYYKKTKNIMWEALLKQKF